MFRRLREIYYVSWADLAFMKHNILNVILMSLMSPILYLIAFGYGLGGSATIEYGGEQIKYVSFMLPGIIALSTLSSSFTSTATRMNVQRLYYKSFDEMLMCPIHYSSIVIGKSILGILRGLLSSIVIFIIGLAVDIGMIPSLGFFAMVLLSCIAFSLLGETAALVVKTHQGMSLFNTLIVLPMTFLCGTFFSTASLPPIFQGILYMIPLTYSSELIRATALGAEFPWILLIALLSYTVVFYFINLYLIKTRRV